MHQHRGLLLLVDGDIARAERLAQRLTGFDFDIRIAGDGANGLLVAHELHPDVIISAGEMPILDGCLMLEALRSKPQTRDTTVILLTDGGSQDELARGWRAGADLCIPRNQGDTELIAMLHRALSSALVREVPGRDLSLVA